MGEKVKARQSAGKAGKHGTPKKGLKGSSFKFGKNDSVERRLKKIRRAFYILYLAFFCGCTSYKGGKVVEGIDIAAGMSVPSTGGTLQLDAFNFCTGFSFAFCEDSRVGCTYTTKSTVNFCGIYESSTEKDIKIELTPKGKKSDSEEVSSEQAQTTQTIE